MNNLEDILKSWYHNPEEKLEGIEYFIKTFKSKGLDEIQTLHTHLHNTTRRLNNVFKDISEDEFCGRIIELIDRYQEDINSVTNAVSNNDNIYVDENGNIVTQVNSTNIVL